MDILLEVLLNRYQHGDVWSDIKRETIRCMGQDAWLIARCKILWKKVKKMEADENKMYYCDLYSKEYGIRKMFGFESKLIRDRVLKIRDAANMTIQDQEGYGIPGQHFRVRIRYLKGGKTIVVRNVAFYSFKDGLLFGTDTRHGNKKIRSYRADRIKGVKVLKNKYKPEWRIEL